ncbi:MAG: hypothetical protein MRK01_13040 [Candidatus Scalindua sp.]|nr:hypothetical protein [Candidatus Scalindua sp.]
MAGVVCLTLMSMVSDSRDERLLAQKEESEVMADRAIELAVLGIPPGRSIGVYERPVVCGRGGVP